MLGSFHVSRGVRVVLKQSSTRRSCSPGEWVRSRIYCPVLAVVGGEKRRVMKDRQPLFCQALLNLPLVICEIFRESGIA